MFRDYNKFPEEELSQIEEETNPKKRLLNEVQKLNLKMAYNSFYYPSGNSVFYIHTDIISIED